MGKPHPKELRQRVVAFVEEGHSHRAAAAHFRVSVKPPKSGPRFRRFYKSFPVLAGAYQGLGAVGCDCTA